VGGGGQDSDELRGFVDELGERRGLLDELSSHYEVQPKACLSNLLQGNSDLVNEVCGAFGATRFFVVRTTSGSASLELTHEVFRARLLRHSGQQQDHTGGEVQQPGRDVVTFAVGGF
jgi:hypothetical protein